MSSRFINCTACKGCHTGRGGRFCKFSPKPVAPAAGKMAAKDPDAPDCDSAQYESYLADKIEEEEERLKSLQEKCRIVSMEEQLAQLRLQSAELAAKQAGSPFTLPTPGVPAPGHAGTGASTPETGVASLLLTAARGPDPARPPPAGPGLSTPAAALSTGFFQRSKEEKEVLSKLKPLSHLSESKPAEKVTYRDFISAMAKVLKLLTDLSIDPRNYIAHMSFIATKAASNAYATDALIKYEEAVTERVIRGQYQDWYPADPECLALHLGPDATYAIRQGGSRWTRQTSASSGGVRDFSEWPKELCWLYNNTNCYFQRCKKAHVCAKCKRTGHAMKDCKNSDDQVPPTTPEAPPQKTQKEARKA